jgi:hypothetical protein
VAHLPVFKVLLVMQKNNNVDVCFVGCVKVDNYMLARFKNRKILESTFPENVDFYKNGR